MIAGQAGCFACAGRDGKIYFRSIGEDEIEIPLKRFKTYKFGDEYKISKVAYEDGIRSFKFGDETGNTLWINQDNIFIVDEEQVQNIYNKLKDLTIYSFEGTVIIDPRIDMGDKIIINGKPVIYQGEMNLSKRFIADIKSKISIKERQETTIKKESQLSINRKILSEIDQENQIITQLVGQQTEISNKLSKHEQTIDSITDTVKQIENYTKEVKGSNEIHITDTQEGNGYVLNFTVFGSTTNMHYLTPKEGLVPHDGLVPNGGFITVVCDKKGRQKPSAEAYQYKIRLNEPLRDLGQVRDELSISNSGVVTVTRRLGTRNGVNGEVYELDQEVIETLEDIKIISPNGTEKSTNAILHTFDEETYIYIKEFYNLDCEIKYITKNDYSEQFVTTVDMEASIKITSKEILSTVKETYASQTELNNMEQTFESSISQTSKSILSTVSNTYATKTSLTDTKTTLETQISQTAESITSTVNNTLKNYSTTTQMNSAITQKASEITTNVSKTYATKNELTTAKSEIKQTTDSITTTVSRKVGDNEIISKINQSSEAVTINASKLNLSGYITATNLKTAGSTVINGSNITTGTIDASKASITNINADNIKSGTITGRTISGGTISGTQITGKSTIELQTTGAATQVIKAIRNNDTKHMVYMTDCNIGLNNGDYNFDLYIDGRYSDNSVMGGMDIHDAKGDTHILGEGITTPKLTQTSLKSKKKNIQKLNANATELIKNADVCSYNFKEEKKGTKKHVGLVIGESYNCPDLVISEDGQGVEQYSMTSVAWKAIQELTERVEKLEGVR